MKSKHKSRKEKADDFRPNPVEILYHNTKRMIEMETKLKTLKEIKEVSADFEENKEEIRQEAIKWVKDDIKSSSINRDGDDLPNGEECMCDWEYSCDFHREGKRMMKFFNLTSEDLK